MVKMYPILLAGLLLSACVTSGVQDQPDFEDKIRAAAKKVDIVKPKAADWCSYESKCKYVGEAFCDTGSSMGEKSCIEKIAMQVVQAGGDTYVAQAAGGLAGVEQSSMYSEDGYYRTYGKVYKCGNKFEKLYAEYSAHNSNPLLQARLDVRSPEYVQACKSMQSCKLTVSDTCGTIRGTPYKYCNLKLNALSKTRGFNRVVLDWEKFNKAGFYRTMFGGYICK